MRSESVAPETRPQPVPDDEGANTGVAQSTNGEPPTAEGSESCGSCAPGNTPPLECPAVQEDGPSRIRGSSASPVDTEPDLAQAVAERVVSSQEFAEMVVRRLAEKVVDDVVDKVAGRLAQEVVVQSSEQLADAVADRIAEAWQRVAERAAAVGPTCGLRPRQRPSVPPRGRVPRA
ncbi:hypothetical protein ACFL5O_01695 [Myxococcota bacterium]